MLDDRCGFRTASSRRSSSMIPDSGRRSCPPAPRRRSLQCACGLRWKRCPRQYGPILKKDDRYPVPSGRDGGTKAGIPPHSHNNVGLHCLLVVGAFRSGRLRRPFAGRPFVGWPVASGLATGYGSGNQAAGSGRSEDVSPRNALLMASLSHRHTPAEIITSQGWGRNRRRCNHMETRELLHDADCSRKTWV